MPASASVSPLLTDQDERDRNQSSGCASGEAAAPRATAPGLAGPGPEADQEQRRDPGRPHEGQDRVCVDGSLQSFTGRVSYRFAGIDDAGDRSHSAAATRPGPNTWLPSAEAGRHLRPV